MMELQVLMGTQEESSGQVEMESASVATFEFHHTEAGLLRPCQVRQTGRPTQLYATQH